MNIFEQLKAAYEAATPGEWTLGTLRGNTMVLADGAELFGGSFCDYFEPGEAEYEFIVKAHNLMPTLIEAVEALEDVIDYTRAYANPDFIGVNAERVVNAERALAKLKGEI